MIFSLASRQPNTTRRWPDVSTGKLTELDVTTKHSWKAQGKLPVKMHSCRRCLAFQTKSRECRSVSSGMCASKADAFCNGKQGINNPDMTWEMVNGTKRIRVHGSIHSPEMVMRGWIHWQRFLSVWDGIISHVHCFSKLICLHTHILVLSWSGFWVKGWRTEQCSYIPKWSTMLAYPSVGSTWDVIIYLTSKSDHIDVGKSDHRLA